MSAEFLSALAEADEDVDADPLPEAWAPDLFACTEVCDCVEAPACADVEVCAPAIPAPIIPTIKIGRIRFTREPLLWAEPATNYDQNLFPNTYK